MNEIKKVKKELLKELKETEDYVLRVDQELKTIDRLFLTVVNETGLKVILKIAEKIIARMEYRLDSRRKKLVDEIHNFTTMVESRNDSADAVFIERINYFYYKIDKMMGLMNGTLSRGGVLTAALTKTNPNWHSELGSKISTGTSYEVKKGNSRKVVKKLLEWCAGLIAIFEELKKEIKKMNEV